METTLSMLEMDRISHSLGIPFYNAFISHKKKDKTLSVKFYRNYYQRQEDSVFEGLVQKGYAVKNTWQEKNYFFVTDSGIEVFRENFAEVVNYQPKQKRDLDYLKKRIETYCKIYNYNFGGGNNYDHVINVYVNEYSKGNTNISKTTKDVTTVFKSELKKHCQA